MGRVSSTFRVKHYRDSNRFESDGVLFHYAQGTPRLKLRKNEKGRAAGAARHHRGCRRSRLPQALPRTVQCPRSPGRPLLRHRRPLRHGRSRAADDGLQQRHQPRRRLHSLGDRRHAAGARGALRLSEVAALKCKRARMDPFCFVVTERHTRSWISIAAILSMSSSR